jgi:hypothetical protein
MTDMAMSGLDAADVRFRQCGGSEIRLRTMEIAMRISESKATLRILVSSVLCEPDVRTAFDPIYGRTSGSGH